jgi:hypothetical protein
MHGPERAHGEVMTGLLARLAKHRLEDRLARLESAAHHFPASASRRMGEQEATCSCSFTMNTSTAAGLHANADRSRWSRSVR